MQAWLVKIEWLVKIDLDKQDYDMVDWKFLCEVMRRKGFGNR